MTKNRASDDLRVIYAYLISLINVQVFNDIGDNISIFRLGWENN